MKNIEEWIDRAENDDEKKFRQAIHLILLAVSRDKVLSQNLVIKGGIVLSLAYGSERYTTDLDLSSLDNMEVLSKEELESKLSKQIKAVVALSDYNLKLLVHSIKYMPKDPSKVKFPAYKARIGYADSTNQKAVKRLDNKQSTHIVELDISFNESVSVSDTENFKLTNRLNVLCYSLEQLVAEKYRSLLQQVVRTRSRRQDIFDIHYLLNQEASLLYSNETKKTVLDKLIKCSERKGIEEYLNQFGMRDEEIKRLSIEDFHTLSLEMDIDTEVSPEGMYTVVQDYFESLPWNDLN
jgi:hypothetical protein